MDRESVQTLIGSLRVYAEWYRGWGAEGTMVPLSASLRSAGGPAGTPVSETVNPSDAHGAISRLREEIGDCTRCKLSRGRTRIVFGSGNPAAELLFVGEAPGEDEDRRGEPFVGKAGQLLTRIIEAMGLRREDVYIANIIKCRPPQNRNPEPDEIAACSPFIRKQIAVIRPRVICALGTFSAQTLLQTGMKISQLRGRFFDLPEEFLGHPAPFVRVMPTFHPAYLLRNPQDKRKVWDDMKLILAELQRAKR